MGKTNEFGRFGENYTKEKKPNKIRIGLLGDSYVAGLDVFPRDHFRNHLEQSLNETDDKYEVLCFGRGNFTLPNTYYYLMHHALDFNLDYVLFFIEARDYAGVISNLNATRYILKNNQLELNTDWKELSTYKIISKVQNNPKISSFLDLSFTSLAYRVKSNIPLKGPSLFFGKFANPTSILFPNHGGTDLFGDSKKWEGNKELSGELNPLAETLLNNLSKMNQPKVIFVVRNYPYKVDKLENYLKQKEYHFISLSKLFDGPLIRDSQVNANYFKATNLYGSHYNHYGHEALGNYLSQAFLEFQ